MKEPIHRKPAVASMVKDPEMGVPMGVCCVVIFVQLRFSQIPKAKKVVAVTV
jgi:hypothetical protein